MARLTAPNGATVTVSDDKVDGLLARGFTAADEAKPAKKTTAKKSSSSKPSK